MQPSQLPRQPYDTSAMHGGAQGQSVPQGQSNHFGSGMPQGLLSAPGSTYHMQQQNLSQQQYQPGTPAGLQQLQVGQPVNQGNSSTTNLTAQHFTGNMNRALPAASIAVPPTANQPAVSMPITGSSAQSVMGISQPVLPATSAPQGWIGNSGQNTHMAARPHAQHMGNMQGRPTSTGAGGSSYSVIPNAHELQKTPGGQAVLNALQSANVPPMVAGGMQWMQPGQGYPSMTSEDSFVLSPQPSLNPPGQAAGKKPRRPKDPNAPPPKRQRKTKKQQEEEALAAALAGAAGASGTVDVGMQGPAAAPGGDAQLASGPSVAGMLDGDEAQPMTGVQVEGPSEPAGLASGAGPLPEVVDGAPSAVDNAKAVVTMVSNAALGSATAVGAAPAAALVGTSALGAAAASPPQALVDKPPTRPFARSRSTVNLAVPEEDKTLITDKALQKLVTKVGGPNSKLSSEVEAVLSELVENFVSTALSFGCSMAYQKQSDSLEAKDIAVHMERTWHIHVPGYPGHEAKRAYRRPAISETHKKRQIAVRKEMAPPVAGAVPTETDAAAAVQLLTAAVPEPQVALAQE